jgi:hypothetical protein
MSYFTFHEIQYANKTTIKQKALVVFCIWENFKMLFRTILTIIFGAVLFIGWHFLMDLTWSQKASYDIFSGALIDFFMFTYLISQFEKREETKRANEMDAHLRKIETLIKKAYANTEEIKKGE